MTDKIVNISKRKLGVCIVALKEVNKFCIDQDKEYVSSCLTLLRNIRKILNKYKDETEMIKNEKLLDILEYQETLLFSETILKNLLNKYRN